MSLLTFECNLAGIINNEINSSEDSSNDPFPIVVVPQDHTNLTMKVNEEDTFIKQINNDSTDDIIYIYG